jgi:hypothetical protein
VIARSRTTQRIAGLWHKPVDIVHIIVAGESPKHRLPQQSPSPWVAAVPARARIGEHFAPVSGQAQAQRFIQLAITACSLRRIEPICQHTNLRHRLRAQRLATVDVAPGAWQTFQGPRHRRNEGTAPSRSPPTHRCRSAQTYVMISSVPCQSLVLQSLHNLSDEQTEYLIRDRISFIAFSIWSSRTRCRMPPRSGCFARPWYRPG